MALRKGLFLFAVLFLALGGIDPLTAAAPKANFTFTPAAPVAGQAVTFTDTSTGSPSAWSWNFGDGGTSSQKNPSHAYATAGTFTVTLKVSNASGSNKVSRSVTVTQAATTSFDGNIVLGSPTANSIRANVFSPNQSGTVYLWYGTSTNPYSNQSPVGQLKPGTPVELALDGLYPDTQYFYRLIFTASGASSPTATSEYTFHTARSAGNSFTFTIQGDSHPEREKTQFNPDLYRRTLLTAAADRPDFHIAIGDDFSVDTLDPSTINAARVIARYTLQRPYFGLIGSSAPVFLTNGNHEQAARYLLNDTPNNVAVWAQNARNSHYSEPAPDGFYTGNTVPVDYIGLLRNYYAWTHPSAAARNEPTCGTSPTGTRSTNGSRRPSSRVAPSTSSSLPTTC